MSVEIERSYSMKEIIEHLGVNRDTTLTWISNYGMPATKAGRFWKFKRTEIEAWVDSLETKKVPFTRRLRNRLFDNVWRSIGLTYQQYSDNTYAVTGIGTCRDTHIVIPTIYLGCPVTRIEKNAFREIDYIEKVTIPNMIEEIGHSAFYGCKNLKSVHIPRSVYYIGDSAFQLCENLTDVFFEIQTLGNIDDLDFEVSALTIGKYAFWMTDIDHFKISDKIASIGAYAFGGCENLVIYSFEDFCVLEEDIKKWDSTWDFKNPLNNEKHDVKWKYLSENPANNDILTKSNEDDYSKNEFLYYNTPLNTAYTKQIFKNAISSLNSWLEEQSIRLIYGIECEKCTMEDVTTKISLFKEDNEALSSAIRKALRKLRHPYRSKALNTNINRVNLLSMKDSGYFELYCAIFGSEWIDFAEFKKEKWLQMSDDSTVSDCCFGNTNAILESEITIRDLVQLNGEAVLELCEERKDLFEEVVSVLYTKQKFLADFTSDNSLSSYIKNIWSNHSKVPEHLAMMTIEELDLSIRSFNCLKRAGVDTIGDLMTRTLEDIQKIRNLGRNSLDEITNKLDALGLRLRTGDE